MPYHPSKHPTSARTTRSLSDPPPSPGPADEPLTVVIVRSARRKKTVGARLLDWHTLEVRAPVDVSEAELQRIISRLTEKALGQRSKLRHYTSDDALEQRAQRLNTLYFGGHLRWRSIRFVKNQNTLFGSCTPSLGTVRISERLAKTPDFVLDYIVMHELAHLRVHNHSRAFWDLVNQLPLVERARGYLMALQFEDDGADVADES
jgi:predicted metal-dependent hydrolase